MKDKIEKLINSIKQIDDDDPSRSKVIYEHQFSNLTTAIEKLVREEAEGYANFRDGFIFKAGSEKWVSRNPNRFPEFCGTSDELFDLYKSKQLKTKQP